LVIVEVGCACESSPININFDIPPFKSKSDDEMWDGDSEFFQSSKIIISDEDGNLYEPEDDTENDTESDSTSGYESTHSNVL